MAIENHAEIIANFEKLGLSSNEARVYLALLENHPITGYQLSKDSGILRPVVYEMLNRLVEKGGARIIKSNPDTYIPLEIEEFLKNIESDFSLAKKHIAKSLQDSQVIDNTDYFWNIMGRKNILNSLYSLIDKAEKELIVAVEDQKNLDDILKHLEERMKKGLHIDIVSHYALETRGINLYTYQLDNHFSSPGIFKNSFAIIADGAESMVVHFTDEKNSKAVYTRNEALVSVTRDSVQSRIYFVRLWRYMGTEKLKMVLGNDDKRLLEAIDRYLNPGR